VLFVSKGIYARLVGNYLRHRFAVPDTGLPAGSGRLHRKGLDVTIPEVIARAPALRLFAAGRLDMVTDLPIRPKARKVENRAAIAGEPRRCHGALQCAVGNPIDIGVSAFQRRALRNRDRNRDRDRALGGHTVGSKVDAAFQRGRRQLRQPNHIGPILSCSGSRDAMCKPCAERLGGAFDPVAAAVFGAIERLISAGDAVFQRLTGVTRCQTDADGKGHVLR